MDNSDTLTLNQARHQVQNEFEEYFTGNSSVSNPHRAMDILMAVKMKPLIEFAHEITLGLMDIQWRSSNSDEIVQKLINKSKSIVYFSIQEEIESAFYATNREA